MSLSCMFLLLALASLTSGQALYQQIDTADDQLRLLTSQVIQITNQLDTSLSTSQKADNSAAVMSQTMNRVMGEIYITTHMYSIYNQILAGLFNIHRPLKIWIHLDNEIDVMCF